MSRASISFIWDNFGPIHADRCTAVGKAFAGRMRVHGIELASRSITYDWVPEAGANFQKTTLFEGVAIEDISLLDRIIRTTKACLKTRSKYFFFCHYESVATLAVATILRILGKRVFVMNDSKFDDYKRTLWRELGKSLFYLPYHGGMASGHRSKDYLRFLGLKERYVEGIYNSLSIERIRNLSEQPMAPDGIVFEERDFIIIARLVPKKNIAMAIEAYQIYASRVVKPRRLNVFGSGPLEDALRAQVFAAGLVDKIIFHGFRQTAEISKALGGSLMLLLPSIEEQFGNVVIEAQAMGVPVTLSDNCGARDTLIKTAINGFVIEADNPRGLAFFMELVGESETLWKDMCLASRLAAPAGDVGRFVDAVEHLLMMRP